MPHIKVLATLASVVLMAIVSIVNISLLGFTLNHANKDLAATIVATETPSTTIIKTYVPPAGAPLTNPPQLLTGKVCSTAGATIQQTFYTQSGDAYDATYACTRCGGTGAITTGTYSWMPTRITTSFRATMCGASVEKTRSVQDITYFVSPLGHCSAQTKNTVQTFKREVPAVAVSCSTSQTTLACTVLTDTTTTSWKNGKVWNSASSPQYGVPAGGQEDYVQTKTIKQTLLESRSCSAPYRKRGLDVCQVYATAADQAQFPFPFLCGKGSSAPIQARLTTFQVSPSFAFPTPRTFAQFATSLKLGMTSEEVRRLQQFLNFQGFSLAVPTALGSIGNETTYFGTANQTALVKFQKAYGVTPATGAFDGNTMSKTNQILVNQQTVPDNTPPPSPPPVQLPAPGAPPIIVPITASCPNGKTLLTSGGGVANPQSITVNVTLYASTSGGSDTTAYEFELNGDYFSGHLLTADIAFILNTSMPIITGRKLNCGYVSAYQTYSLGCQSGFMEVRSNPNLSCSIPAAAYASSDSQADADAQALADLATNCPYMATFVGIPQCHVPSPVAGGAGSYFSAGYCGTLDNGATFYENATVPFGNACVSEYRKCSLTSPEFSPPTVAMSGSYTWLTCTVDPAPPPPPTPPTSYGSGSGSGYYAPPSGSGSGSGTPPPTSF